MITEFSKTLMVSESDVADLRHLSGRLSYIRQLYWYLLKKNGFSNADISRLTGKDHATILYGVKRIENLLQVGDKDITRLYELTKNIKR
jgi:chromosomal replication initiation ATPase DnaA